MAATLGLLLPADLLAEVARWAHEPCSSATSLLYSRRARTIVRMAQVCRGWRAAMEASSAYLWDLMVRLDFPEAHARQLEQPGASSWLELYKHRATRPREWAREFPDRQIDLSSYESMLAADPSMLAVEDDRWTMLEQLAAKMKYARARPRICYPF